MKEIDELIEKYNQVIKENDFNGLDHYKERLFKKDLETLKAELKEQQIQSLRILYSNNQLFIPMGIDFDEWIEQYYNENH